MTGDDIILKCALDGTPTPRVFWAMGARTVANFPRKLYNSLIVFFLFLTMCNCAGYAEVNIEKLPPAECCETLMIMHRFLNYFDYFIY